VSDDELRKIFRKNLRGFDWQAIETGSTSGGVPDMNYAAGGGIEGWIENKRADHWRCVIRPMQIGWCERRLRFNPRVFCAVRRAHDELWFFHASKLRELLTQRIDTVTCIGHWSGGPARWDWQLLSRTLGNANCKSHDG
jgi:hypothetical protein